MVGTQMAACTPAPSATTAIEMAATPTPTGCAICRTPIASPRRSGGNQPTTTRPPAAFVLAAAAPARNSVTTSSAVPPERAAASPAAVVAASPVRRGKRSPRRSATAPHATSVSITPSVGDAATRPASARVRPLACSAGMRNAGPCTITAVAAWASVLAASIAQRRAAPTACAGPSVWVTRPSQLSRARRTAPRLVEWCVRKPSADLGLGHAQVDHRAGAVEQRDPQGHHRDAELRLLDDVALQLRHARDLDDVGVGEALRLAVGGDGA